MPFKLLQTGLVQRFTVTQPVPDGDAETTWSPPVVQATNQVIRIDSADFQFGDGIANWGVDAASVVGRLFLSTVSPEAQTTVPQGFISEASTILTYDIGLWSLGTSGASYISKVLRLFPATELLVAVDALFPAVHSEATGVANTGHFRFNYSVGTVTAQEFLTSRLASCCG